MLSHVNGTSCQISLCSHHQRLPILSLHGQWSSLLCVNLPIVGAHCLIPLETGVAHYVISHNLVNLTIFCYDYKLRLSTIITFEK